MLRWAEGLGELDAVSAGIARRLVDTLLLHQRASLLTSAVAFIVLGLVSFIGTGSPWYVAALVVALCILFWRLHQARSYARAPDSATPVAWARRFLRAGWVAA